MWIVIIIVEEVDADKHNGCPIERWSEKYKHCEENFLLIEMSIESSFVILQIYLIVMVRQNYINLRDGAGEVNKRNQSQLLIMQQEQLMTETIRNSEAQRGYGSEKTKTLFFGAQNPLNSSQKSLSSLITKEAE